MHTTASLKKMKASKDQIVMLTAYDAPSAKLSEEAEVDVILVGDSVGMVVLGYDSTVPVTLEDMLHHAKACRRGAKDTFIVTDMPFMTYHSSISETMANARRIMQETGSNAVKLEGNGIVIDHTRALVQAGVPVVSHLGLTPQTVGVTGGYKVQAKKEEDKEQLLTDAKAIEEAGACMLVLECVPEGIAKQVAEAIDIPVIGIGAGRQVDGQVLVYHDLIGYYSGHVAKFVKQYASVNDSIRDAIKSYTKDVKHHDFPEEKHVFEPDEKVTLYGGSSS
ncbi:3-methyl-2-oxobutanoate hydroxymethyltransferase [Paenalkalicoccus suaedae]|uniref:3-methyl-2-oxobutanoate hydroxymethyltransferase n=1 Tax=Paenalkalicoccus suaedae TaxID=2592382 RepID=A0A859FE21_9BACI|nr:3-methyl-2-oxobutanoate hydroxymethyltransferase [Paenalkalicoccus suaedae]QKS71121.1 3-methyl-2-oxobutanoate hydroxymethyltransferase [Paenalkalicoccus suaedae]